MTDELISRQALIEQETFLRDEDGFERSCVLSSDIRYMLSVDAEEVVRCKDCKYKHSITREGVVLCSHRGKLIQMKASDFCSYGKREDEMNDLISRQTALEDFEKCNSENPKWTPARVKTLLVRQPAVEAVPVVRCEECWRYTNRRKEIERCEKS